MASGVSVSNVPACEAMAEQAWKYMKVDRHQQCVDNIKAIREKRTLLEGEVRGNLYSDEGVNGSRYYEEAFISY